MTAHKQRARKLEDRGHDYRAANRQGAGADARPHGVGDVVRADPPGHVHGEYTGHPENHGNPERARVQLSSPGWLDARG